MMKIILIILFSIFIVHNVHAGTVEEYIQEIDSLANAKKYDQAIRVVEKGLKEFPGYGSLLMAGADVLAQKGDYEMAIANYLNLMAAIKAGGEPEPKSIHYKLANAYNELGQKHYFPPELSLRIIYHTEKLLEADEESAESKEYIEFLRKSVGQYDAAVMGGLRVQVMEASGDGNEFNLPDDHISQDEKILYKEKGMRRIADFDKAIQKSSFVTSKSDKTFDDMAAIVEKQSSMVRTIRFRRMDIADGHNKILEDIAYKYPNKLKVIEPQAITLINDQGYFVLDPKNKNIIDQENLSAGSRSMLRGVGFYDLNEMGDDYQFDVERIDACPDFLSLVCVSNQTELYLVTGRLKDGHNGPYPPMPKIEYFVDAKTGLCLSRREYWLGVLGSGKEEEMAKEMRVTRIKTTPANISLAVEGMTRGYVQELADLKEEWMVEIGTINQNMDDKIFNVTN